MTVMSDIYQFVGPAGVLGTTFGAFVGMGAGIDNSITANDRKNFGQYLASERLHKDVRLFPAGTYELFEQVFGTNHWSLKCFFRSCAFTFGTLIIFGMLAVLHGREWANAILGMVSPAVGLGGAFDAVTRRVCYSLIASALVVDYLNLYKSRRIVRFLASGPPRSLSICALILLCDLAVYYLIYVALACAFVLVVSPPDMDTVVKIYLYTLRSGAKVLIQAGGALRGDKMFFLLFLAGLVPSLWFWACVTAVALANVFAPIKPIWRILDVKGAPMRSVGIVASIIIAVPYLLFAVAQWWVR